MLLFDPANDESQDGRPGGPPKVCLLEDLGESSSPSALRLHLSFTDFYYEKISGLAAALAGPAARLQAIEAH